MTEHKWKEERKPLVLRSSLAKNASQGKENLQLILPTWTPRELMDHRFWLKAYCLGRESCKSDGKSCFLNWKLMTNYCRAIGRNITQRLGRGVLPSLAENAGWSCYVRRTGASVAQQYFLGRTEPLRTMWCWHSIILASRSGKWYE